MKKLTLLFALLLVLAACAPAAPVSSATPTPSVTQTLTSQPYATTTETETPIPEPTPTSTLEASPTPEIAVNFDVTKVNLGALKVVQSSELQHRYTQYEQQVYFPDASVPPADLRKGPQMITGLMTLRCTINNCKFVDMFKTEYNAVIGTFAFLNAEGKQNIVYLYLGGADGDYYTLAQAQKTLNFMNTILQGGNDGEIMMIMMNDAANQNGNTYWYWGLIDDDIRNGFKKWDETDVLPDILKGLIIFGFIE